MNLLCLGDSLLFGRTKHNIFLNNTWPMLLSKNLSASTQIRGHQGATMRDVINECTLLQAYWYGSKSTLIQKSDIALVQVGIVDATPRLLPKKLHLQAKKTFLYRKLMRSPFAYKLAGNPWTSLVAFRNQIRELKKILSEIAFQSYFIEICPPVNNLVKNVGDFSSILEKYNCALEKEVGTNDFISWVEPSNQHKYVLEDGHHLSAAGHMHLAQCCLSHIKNYSEY